MRYIYHITFSGIINDIPDEQQQLPEATLPAYQRGSPEKETFDDIRALVIESFRPDLQAGVTIASNDIHIAEA